MRTFLRSRPLGRAAIGTLVAAAAVLAALGPGCDEEIEPVQEAAIGIAPQHVEVTTNDVVTFVASGARNYRWTLSGGTNETLGPWGILSRTTGNRVTYYPLREPDAGQPRTVLTLTVSGAIGDTSSPAPGSSNATTAASLSASAYIFHRRLFDTPIDVPEGEVWVEPVESDMYDVDSTVTLVAFGGSDYVWTIEPSPSEGAWGSLSANTGGTITYRALRMPEEGEAVTRVVTVTGTVGGPNSTTRASAYAYVRHHPTNAVPDNLIAVSPTEVYVTTADVTFTASGGSGYVWTLEATPTNAWGSLSATSGTTVVYHPLRRPDPGDTVMRVLTVSGALGGNPSVRGSAQAVIYHQ